ncbi:hypothetical protein NA57DRAFT_75089 [Rhizodiscina lignyota]|uniref:Reverse transcriptase domain-containing protein n=1 Tax=Rhizodiscina lignyota TaxID=1504668 RepID=A0A9P4IHZ9_9PEZI|nr:hypothetical protein NA57DRAFT_75089 [Rhizodiscina lignyota]
MASAVLSTLHHVTEKKLEKLVELRKRFDSQRQAILKAAESEPSLEKKVRALLEGCEKHSITVGRTGISEKNVTRFLDQSKHDPSVSEALLKQWQQKLEHDLDIQALKYEYASLFGRLVTEWIENPNDAVAGASGQKRRDSDSSEESSTSFEQVGREEMHEQRKEWESYAFKAKETDQSAIEKYLQELFATVHKSKKLKKTPLEELREKLKDIDKMSPERFDAGIVCTCIQGLLRADLFTGPKREALVDLRDRDDVLAEMADVLNMDLDSLEEWKWDPQPVPLHMRRQLNGKYRVFMDEELHQAIFLHFIGSKWAVLLKQTFTSFFHSGAWLVNPYKAMGKRDRQRREFFLGSDSGLRNASTVRNERRTMYETDYFMTQLPSQFHGGGRDYGDDSVDSFALGERKAPMVIKQSMLRLATAELLVNTKLYGGFTILQSDFKWFGPSLPHSTIFTVLKFFGVKTKWLRFFKKFLETPLSFAHDGADSEVRRRQRGIPMSHILSDALGEAVLFCLDFAVNQRTKGANIYRFHDDLWFWGQETVCAEAWKAILEFSKVMGLELNEEKTGAVQVSGEAGSIKKPSSVLPSGAVRWGFLKLDARSGRWVIDKEEVEDHIKELQRQLSACRSVFAWVQAYNSYVDRFFSNNFGQPARCFGKEHVKMVIETFEYIQRRLFDSDQGSGANVTEYLRKVIRERFDVTDLPDGFFYLPIELGGLELRSPFIPLFMQVRHPFISPKERVNRAFEKEEEDYERLKEKYDSGEHNPNLNTSAYKPEEDEPFMGFKEFTSFMEETSSYLHRTYEELMEASPEDVLEATQDVENALKTLPSNIEFSGDFSQTWGGLKPYWKWALELYATDLIERFGGLAMGDQGLLPIGLVSMLRSEKFRWQS